MVPTDVTPLVAGQSLTREAVQAARVPDGFVDRDTGAIEVYVVCDCCEQALAKTFVKPTMQVAPVDYCYFCYTDFSRMQDAGFFSRGEDAGL